MDLNMTFSNLSQLSRAYGAPAVDLAGRVLQKEAQFSIALGLVAIGGVAAGLAVSAFGLAMDTKREEKLEAHYRDRALKHPGYGAEAEFTTIGGALLAVVSLVTACMNLLSGWTWIALTDPNLALAHRIFGSMGG